MSLILSFQFCIGNYTADAEAISELIST